MKVYLDSCSLQRPLDSKTQIRIRLEAEAILGLFALVESDQIELVSSEVLRFEINRIPNAIRRQYGLEVLAKATLEIELNAHIERRAKRFEEIGIKLFDALHLASAEEARVDYFCTCDDKLLKKAKSVIDLKTKAVSPTELIEEIEQ